MKPARKQQQVKAIEQAQLVTLFELHLIEEVLLVETSDGLFELQVRDNQGNRLVLATKRAAEESRLFKKADAAISFIKSHCNMRGEPQVSILLRTAT